MENVEKAKKPKSIYMAITNDALELPVFWADTGKELAKIVGVAASKVLTYVCMEKNQERYKENGKKRRLTKAKLRFIKVDLPDDEEDLMADAPMK